MQHKILFSDCWGFGEARVVFLWKFFLNVIQIWVCIKAQWERPSEHTSGHAMLTSSLYFFYISLLFNMPERIYTEYGKGLLQRLGWYVCQRAGESSWGLLTRQGPGQSHHPRQNGGPWEQLGWHICSLFTVRSSRTHGWAQATELPVLRSQAGRAQAIL